MCISDTCTSSFFLNFFLLNFFFTNTQQKKLFLINNMFDFHECELGIQKYENVKTDTLCGLGLVVRDKEFWATTKVCVKVLLTAVKVLRFSDGMRGGNLGLMYNLLLQLDELYSSRIDGLPEKVRTKVSPRCIV